jgi:hypothetical protein
MRPTRIIACLIGLGLATALPAAIAAPSPCAEAAKVDPRGNVMLPTGATEVEGPVDVDEELGTLSSQYPGVDTTTTAMYPLPCEPSIGGTLPPDAEDPETDEDQHTDDQVDAFEKDGVLDLINLQPPISLPQLPLFEKAPVCYYKNNVVPCSSPYLLNDSQPFAGRDIILVQGFSLGTLLDNAAGNLGAHKKWPQDQAAFEPGGYFYQRAWDYWSPHVREHLWDMTAPNNLTAGYQWPPNQGNPSYVPKYNRLLVVAWNTAQRLEVSQHAFLTQVIRAMNDGHNVQTPPSYPPPSVIKMPFCANGCIVISHSTGGLIVNTALGKLQDGQYGISHRPLVKRFRGHVAFASALGGSRLAPAAISASAITNPSDPVCGIISAWGGSTGLCGWSQQRALDSVLADLTPSYTRQRWVPVMNMSPVSTVTVSGAHTTGNYGILNDAINTKLLHPGNDDGVVTMNSSCGNPQAVEPHVVPPSGFTVTSLIKAFDMGIPGTRAIGVFRDQRRIKANAPASRYMAAMCSPWLSPTGMVMPVDNSFLGTGLSAQQRLNNTYSFIQGAIDHSYLGGTDDDNPFPSTNGGSAMIPREYLDTFWGSAVREESSAITDTQIYAAGPDGVRTVHPSFAAQMKEYQRGRKISFKLFGTKYTWWIWRRTYHLLNHWEDKAATHFAYEYAYRRN